MKPGLNDNVMRVMMIVFVVAVNWLLNPVEHL